VCHCLLFHTCFLLMCFFLFFFFFFSSRRRHTRWPRDWSSDVCSSDLLLREFVFHLKDLGLAAASIRRQVSALRSYFRFLVGEGYLTHDPTMQLETPKAWRKLPSVLAVSEVEALLAAPDPDEPLAWRDRALLEVAYGTGAR